MRFYKRNNGEIYEKREAPLTVSDECEEITEDEYNSAIEEIHLKIQAEIETVEAQNQSYIEQLEAENAALLFQILTGEEYADV